MIDSIADHSGEAASQLFPGVFAGLGKWLRPKPPKLRCKINKADHAASL
jgi:hypothetical protein